MAEITTREIALEDGSKVVLRSGPYGSIRLGLIEGRRLLSLHAKEHVGIDVPVEKLQELRAAIDDAIREKLGG